MTNATHFEMAIWIILKLLAAWFVFHSMIWLAGSAISSLRRSVGGH